MRFLKGVLLIMTASVSIASEDPVLDQDFRRLASDDVVNLGEEYGGKVILVVNTASKCGNTPNMTVSKSCMNNMATTDSSSWASPPTIFSGRNQAPRRKSRRFAG